MKRLSQSGSSNFCPELRKNALLISQSHFSNFSLHVITLLMERMLTEDVNEQSDDEDEVGIPQMNKGKNYPSFKEFSQLLKKEARIACNPVISQCFLKETKESNNKQFRRRNVGVNSFSMQTEDFSSTLKKDQ